MAALNSAASTCRLDRAYFSRGLPANRDSERFEDPDDFDFQRERPDHHVSFGYANHYCVGLHLARAEARIAFEVILSRLANIRLDAPAGSLEYGSSPVLRIPKRLPLLFDAVEA